MQQKKKEKERKINPTIKMKKTHLNVINISVFGALKFIYSVRMISLSDEEISIPYSFSSNVIVFNAHFDKNSIETILCFPTMVSMCVWCLLNFERQTKGFQWNELINGYRTVTMDIMDSRIFDSFRYSMGLNEPFICCFSDQISAILW